LRFYLIIIRYSFLKGGDWGVIWSQIFSLIGLATIFLAVSVQRFHKSLD
jgi:ABC-2 type transport system permease protein